MALDTDVAIFLVLVVNLFRKLQKEENMPGNLVKVFEMLQVVPTT